MAFSSFIINIMFAEEQATQGTWASAAMLLICIIVPTLYLTICRILTIMSIVPLLFVYPFWTLKPVTSVWPSDVIWRQRSGSTLAQVMACCLTAPSHYLNQFWLIASYMTYSIPPRVSGGMLDLKPANMVLEMGVVLRTTPIVTLPLHAPELLQSCTKLCLLGAIFKL